MRSDGDSAFYSRASSRATGATTAVSFPLAGPVVDKALLEFPVPPQKIACGFYHSAAIHKPKSAEAVQEQEAWSWGRNLYNALGLPSTDRKTQLPEKAKFEDNRQQPKQVEDAGDDVFEVACATHHTVFLKTNGDIVCTGLGTHGRLGMRNPEEEASISMSDEAEEPWWYLPTNISRGAPSRARGLPVRAVRVACGADHTLVYTEDKRLWAFGMNSYGQCGMNASRAAIYKPTRLDTLSPDKEIKHFAAGSNHSLAVCGDAGTGDLYAWGCAENGRLGLGEFDTGKKIVDHPDLVAAAADWNLVFVAAGEAHSGAIDEEGCVLMWGAGSYGRLGHTDCQDQAVPKAVSKFDGKKIRRLALGAWHSLFLEDGASPAIWACGTGAAVGLLSAQDSDKVQVLPQVLKVDRDRSVKDARIVQIAAGMFHSMALLQNGDVMSWGVGTNGRLGDGREENLYVPLQIQGFSGYHSASKEELFEGLKGARSSKTREDQSKAPEEVKAFACGTLHTLVLLNGGSLYGFGCNVDGQLGLGPNSSYEWIPRALSVGNKRVMEIASGYEHVLAITFTREIWAWGKGTDGQLGTEYTRNETEPQLLTTIQKEGKAWRCAAGETHSACLVKAKENQPAQLWTWGSADGGRLGQGVDVVSGPQSKPNLVTFEGHGPRTSESGPRPKQKAKGRVTGMQQLDDVGPVSIHCGPNHSIVVVAKGVDGTTQADFPQQLWSFGGGLHGKLGLGENLLNNQYEPKQILGWTKLGLFTKDVGVGSTFSVAVSHHGSLYFWGKGSMVNEPIDRPVPKKFTGFDDRKNKVRFVVCRDRHIFVVTESGGCLSWGNNEDGQLGLGANARSEEKSPEAMNIQGLHVLASGPQHAIARFTNGDIMSWGSRTCGKLALLETVTSNHVLEPKRVNSTWEMSEQAANEEKKKEEQQSEQQSKAQAFRPPDRGRADVPEKLELIGGGVEKAEQDEVKTLEKSLAMQKAGGFAAMQATIQQEKSECQPNELYYYEEGIQKRLDKIIEDLRGIPAKEAAAEKSAAELEQSLRTNVRNLKIQGNAGPPVFPTTAHQTIAAAKPKYQDLLWALQQQVYYFAQLSTEVRSAHEISSLENIIWRVYSSDPSPRTNCLFLLLLRNMINKEIEVCQKQDEVFSRPGGHASLVFQMFSKYALSPRHYKDLVHVYLKLEKKGEDAGKHMNIMQLLKDHIMKATSATIPFALTQESYEKVFNGGDLEGADPNEVRQGFNKSMEKFADFLKDRAKFGSITRVALPADLRKLLAYARTAIGARKYNVQPTEGMKKAQISSDLYEYLPLLALFVRGILIPLLKDKKYVSADTYLKHTAESMDQETRHNMEVLAEFLEQMVTFQVEESTTSMKILVAACGDLRKNLLEYLKEQVDVVDDIDTNILSETFVAHLDKGTHPVVLETTDLMFLTNILDQYKNKLRITEHDMVYEKVLQLRTFTAPEINEVMKGGSNTLHNFDLDYRFLFAKERNDENAVVSFGTGPGFTSMYYCGRSLGIAAIPGGDGRCGPDRGPQCASCKRYQARKSSAIDGDGGGGAPGPDGGADVFLDALSNCPLPRQLCGSKLSRQLMNAYPHYHQDSPQTVIEVLFRVMDMTSASDFRELQAEFNRVLREEKQRTDYDKIEKLKKGIATLDELISVAARPEDLCGRLAKAMAARFSHYQYLLRVDKAVTRIAEAHRMYNREQGRQLVEIEAALKFSLTLNLPKGLTDAARGKKELAFELYTQQKDKRHHANEGLIMKELDCAPAPQQTYNVRQLKQIKVLVQVHPPYDQLTRNLEIAIKASTTGGVNLTMTVVNGKSASIVASHAISAAALQEMAHEDSETIELPRPPEKPFLTVNSRKFVDAVAKLRK